jgi:hypothetical protein
MVSPKLLSDFVPDVTLIAFPIPKAAGRTARWQAFAHASSFVRAKKMVLI